MSFLLIPTELSPIILAGSAATLTNAGMSIFIDVFIPINE